MGLFENRLFLRQNTFFLCVLAKLKFYLSPKLNFLSRFGELSVCPDNKKAFIIIQSAIFIDGGCYNHNGDG